MSGTGWARIISFLGVAWTALSVRLELTSRVPMFQLDVDGRLLAPPAGTRYGGASGLDQITGWLVCMIEPASRPRTGFLWVVGLLADVGRRNFPRVTSNFLLSRPAIVVFPLPPRWSRQDRDAHGLHSEHPPFAARCSARAESMAGTAGRHDQFGSLSSPSARAEPPPPSCRAAPAARDPPAAAKPAKGRLL